MKNKLKILTVLGTRPEIIRLSCLINRFNKYFDHKLVFTGQNYSKELSAFFFKNFKIHPNINLNINNSNVSLSISEMIIKIDKIIDEFKPDCFFVLGDTNSALTSIIAKKKQIPIFHYEAGNRCFDHRVPEETNRKIIDIISDVNLTYSNSSKLNLIKENFPIDRVFNVGSPLREVFNEQLSKIKKNNILKKLNLKKKKFLLMSLHREENIENLNNLRKIINSINYLSEKMKLKVIFPAHPRTKKKLSNFKINNLVNILSPLDFFSYNKLQTSSLLVLSDSGSIAEESYILKFPAIMLRQAHERHEAMERGTVIMSAFDKNSIYNNVLLSLKNFNERIHFIDDYEIKTFKIIIISSYVDFINKKVY